MNMLINGGSQILDDESPKEIVSFMAGRASELDGMTSDLTALLAEANSENDNLRIELEDTEDKLFDACEEIERLRKERRELRDEIVILRKKLTQYGVPF